MIIMKMMVKIIKNTILLLQRRYVSIQLKLCQIVLKMQWENAIPASLRIISLWFLSFHTMKLWSFLYMSCNIDWFLPFFAHHVTILLMETAWWYSTRIHHYLLIIFNLKYFISTLISTISLRLCFHHFCVFRYLHRIHPKAKEEKWKYSLDLDWKTVRHLSSESFNWPVI